jgi:histidinol-phosphate aminotransferase
MLPLVNDVYLTLQPYAPGKPVSETERELGISGAVKLASNENPYGPSPKAMAALAKALTSLADYPDGGAFYLKQALARKHGVGVESVIVGNGTNDNIEMAVKTFVRPDESMLYTQPSFVIFKLVAQSLGREVRVVPSTSDLKHDLKALACAADGRTKLVFLDNPINPTGRYVARAELEAFFAEVPDDLLVVMDEAYFEFAVAPD